MDVHLPLSATIKVVKMEHKKKKITMGFALLLCAMVALVGVGYALAYQGSATTPTGDTGSDIITVDLTKSGFTGTLFTVDTVNDTTNNAGVTLSSLRYDGTNLVPASGESLPVMSSLHFKYSGGAFTLVDSYDVGDPTYSCAKVGSVTATIYEETVSASSKVNLAISGAQAPDVNQYGLSFVYVYNNAVYDPYNAGADATISNLDIHTGSVSVTLDAYVVYSDIVPRANISDIDVFTLSESTLTFTATPVA